MRRRLKDLLEYRASFYVVNILLLLILKSALSQEMRQSQVHFGRLTAAQVIAFAQKKRAELDSSLKDYACFTYSKMTTRSLDGTRELLQLEETSSRIYWKFPEKFKEIIMGKRKTRKKSLRARVEFGLGIISGNYNEVFQLGEIEVPSPIGTNAFKNYHFKLRGRIRMGATEVYELEVSPHSKYQSRIIGKIWIEDDNFNLVGADFTFNRATLLPKYVEKIRVKLEYIRFFKKYWLFSKQVTEVDGYVPPFWRAHAIRSTYFSDYKINSGLYDQPFAGPELEIHPNADNPESAIWKNRQPLTLEEKKFVNE